MDIGDLLGGRDLNDAKKAVGFVMANSDDFEKILKRLNDGSGTIGDVASEIESLAGNLQNLSGILANVGEALADLGTKLSESGGSVKTLIS
ncbi:hypothetical protein ACFPJ1_07650 [Kribbella qitaiheensis]|uniref:hypothetical protein n=1 Tax=Kribbella qitaiheensis TaxID=1544730 RepID=UPI00361F4489